MSNKQQISIRLSVDVIDYFKAMSAETAIPYQSLINSYLRHCMDTELILFKGGV